MAEAENLQEKRNKYEDIVVREVGNLSSLVTQVNSKVEAMQLQLAQVNLLEIKTNLRSVQDELLKFNLTEVRTMVLKHDRQITRATAIVVFVQIAIGLAAAAMRFFQ
jgi:hypothetical protein